jgi:hypothetical protein
MHVFMKILNVNRESLNNVEGWLSNDALLLTEFLFAFQRQNDWISGVLELGVFKGKYLSLLAQQASGSCVPIVGVDAFLERHGVRLADEHKQFAEATILNAVRSVAGSTDNVTLIAGYTHEVSQARLRDLCPAGYSFISVDAGHDAEDVEHDSALADSLLSAQGIAAFDDIYNAVCPGVAEGFFRYMMGDSRDLAPFATCGNKVFVCRPAMHSRYYDFSMQLARGIKEAAPELARTLDQLVANEENHWSPRLCGYDIIPFL